MPTRSWIALLLLINYLLVVGVGCMSRPEDQRELVLVQTSQEGHHYQNCRYLRMDGLESFLDEALSSQYQSAPEIPRHHLISVVFGVDSHCFTQVAWLTPPVPLYQWANAPMVDDQSPNQAGVNRAVNPPPWSV